MIRYSDARRAIVQHLSDPSRPLSALLSAEKLLLQRISDPSESALRQDDAQKSIEVLHQIQSMGNKLGSYNFSTADRKQEKLYIEGVEVSIFADLMVHGTKKGEDEIGAAILRMTVDDASTLAAKEKRKNMGLYVATLARLHVEENLANGIRPANRLCMSIDVMHGETFVAPAANTQRIKDIRSACKMISALWNS